MNHSDSIDFPPRQFSSVEIKALLLLSAEVSENISIIGQSLVALENATYLDQTANEIIRHMSHEAMLARGRIDEIVSIISIEQELIKSEAHTIADT